MAAIALHRRVIGCVHQVDGNVLGRVGHVVGRVQRANVLMTRPHRVLSYIRARGVEAANGKLHEGTLTTAVVAAAAVVAA